MQMMLDERNFLQLQVSSEENEQAEKIPLHWNVYIYVYVTLL